ncbi:MAG: FAD-dependent thymidylate synthase [Bacillota bacterium]
MQVKLIRHTPHPDRTVAAAARLCYSAAGVEDLLSMDDTEVRRMINLLRERGHESPFEHAYFTFVVEGISRACSHQLVRHRLASYSQQSQRWVRGDAGEHVMPPSVARNPEAARLFSEFLGRAGEVYRVLTTMGIPKEDARYVLPNAVVTRLAVTMNARELLHVFRVRCCQRAQWEIRALAYLMLRECRRVAPLLFEKAGPPCQAEGFCPEKWAECPRYPRVSLAASPGANPSPPSPASRGGGFSS